MKKLAPLDRFNAFSDGVYAIVITLLALELPVPEGDAPLFASLVAEWPTFLGYLISFSLIGGIWIQHASLTKLMKSADIPSYGLNLLLLLFAGVLPFATKLLVSHLYQEDVALAVIIYGVNMLLASATLSALMMYVANKPFLVMDDLADEELRDLYRKRWISIAVNAGALFIAVIAPLVAILLYLAQSLLLLVMPLISVRFRGSRDEVARS